MTRNEREDPRAERTSERGAHPQSRRGGGERRETRRQGRAGGNPVETVCGILSGVEKADVQEDVGFMANAKRRRFVGARLRLLV